MSAFFVCFLQIMLYTLGVTVACGLAVELCYQLCFSLMGRRTTRTLWLVTGWLGTPIHELGHALMCLLFAHRIERIRLWPTRESNAMVEHSYNRRNPYASFGNVWIALGPIFAGLGVILLVLSLVYPDTLSRMGQSLSLAMQGGESFSFLGEVGTWIHGLWNEQTRGIGWRILAVGMMLSTALHVRLSLADVKGMITGLPIYAAVAAVVASVAAIMGEGVRTALTGALQRLSWMIVLLFALIMIFALVLLALLLAFRLAVGLFTFFFGRRR